MAFIGPFVAMAGRTALGGVARAGLATAERAVMPLASSVAREVSREAGMAAAQVVGQSAVDHISSTIHNTTSGPIGQAVGAVVTQAGSTAGAAVKFSTGNIASVYVTNLSQFRGRVAQG